MYLLQMIFSSEKLLKRELRTWPIENAQFLHKFRPSASPVDQALFRTFLISPKCELVVTLKYTSENSSSKGSF